MRPLLSFFNRGDMEQVTVFTANIGRTSTAEQRQVNLRRIKDTVKTLDSVVVGWQEIDEADTGDEHAMLTQLWPRQVFAGFGTAVPQLFNMPVIPQKSRVTVTSEGRAKVSPTRFCVQTIAEVGPYKVVFMNGHYPFNAPDLRRQCNREWTRLAHDWHEQGYPVITTRDTNWHGRVPKLHPRERLLTPSGIDRITFIPASGVTARVNKRHKINLTIDGHDAIGLTLSLKG